MLTFTVVCFAVCLLVLALVLAATRPGPAVPAHSAPGRHDWLASLDRARDVTAVHIGGIRA